MSALVWMRFAAFALLVIAGAVLTALTAELPEGDGDFALALWIMFAAVAAVTLAAVAATYIEEDRP